MKNGENRLFELCLKDYRDIYIREFGIRLEFKQLKLS